MFVNGTLLHDVHWGEEHAWYAVNFAQWEGEAEAMGDVVFNESAEERVVGDCSFMVPKKVGFIYIGNSLFLHDDINMPV